MIRGQALPPMPLRQLTMRRTKELSSPITLGEVAVIVKRSTMRLMRRVRRGLYLLRRLVIVHKTLTQAPPILPATT